MHSLEYPQLEVAQPGSCASDRSVTRTQLPDGSYLCPACVCDYRRRGWLDSDFEYTEVFLAQRSKLSPFRVRRKAQGGVVIDTERVVAELRRLIASGAPVEVAVRRLRTEAQVGYSPLAPAVASVLSLGLQDARRLVVRVIDSAW